jgi:hypothetical protein
LHVVVDGTSPISGTVTANQGTPNSVANSWPVEVTDGTNVLGTSSHPLRIDPTGTTTQPISGTVTANAGSGTFAISAASLPLPTGAATSANQTNASQKTQIVDGSGNVIASTSNALNVDVTNTVPVTLTSTTITGTVAATQSGTWTVQPGNTPNTTAWLVQNSPATSGGLLSNVQQALTTSAQIKASTGQKYGYLITNPNAVTVYVFYYNTTSAPTIGSTTNLVDQIGIPAGSAANLMHTIGLAFSTGIYVAVSTSATSSAAPSTGLTITTYYF